MQSHGYLAAPVVDHNGHYPNGLATLRSIVGNCISNGCADIVVLRISSYQGLGTAAMQGHDGVASYSWLGDLGQI